MSQTDVVEWLAGKRSSGDNRFFTVKEIREGLKIRGYGYLNVDLQASQLHHYGVLEMRQYKPHAKQKLGVYYGGLWRRSYRIKAKFVGEKS